MNVIFNIGIFLSLFLFILLITKRYISLPDKLLAVWMCIIGIHLLSYYLYYLNFWDKWPHLIGVTVPFPLLHGPMLYLYTLYSLRGETQIRKKDWLHFAPALLSYMYMARFFFFYSAEEKMMVDNGQLDDYGLFSSILMVAFLISGLAYTILSYKILTRYKRLIKTNFSFEERINLDWLKYSIWGIGCIFFTAAVIVLLREGMGVEFSFNADLIFYSMIVVFVFCIGFYGIRRQDIFSNNMISDNKQLVRDKPESEYKKSGLKTEMANTSHQELLKIMGDEKPFLNPRLTIGDLAREVHISPNHLSQIINQYEQVNFHDFINKYRVEEFIQRARTNSNFSILAHAFDSGFNSKSSFNIVFKKVHGVPPSKYMAELKKNA